MKSRPRAFSKKYRPPMRSIASVFARQEVVRKPVRRNPQARHAARVGLRFERCRRSGRASKVVRAVDPRGAPPPTATCAETGVAAGFSLSMKRLLDGRRVVRGVALQVLIGDRGVDLFAHAGLFSHGRTQTRPQEPTKG